MSRFSQLLPPVFVVVTECARGGVLAKLATKLWKLWLRNVLGEFEHCGYVRATWSARKMCWDALEGGVLFVQATGCSRRAAECDTAHNNA